MKEHFYIRRFSSREQARSYAYHSEHSAFVLRKVNAQIITRLIKLYGEGCERITVWGSVYDRDGERLKRIGEVIGMEEIKIRNEDGSVKQLDVLWKPLSKIVKLAVW